MAQEPTEAKKQNHLQYAAERANEGLVKLPEYMQGAVRRYLFEGVPPGDFLTAVLENDLGEACARADATNRVMLHDYMIFFYNFAPSSSFGSPRLFREWVLSGGLRRMAGEQSLEFDYPA